MIIVLVLVLILIAVVGGKGSKDLMKGLISISFGAVLLMAGCAVV